MNVLQSQTNLSEPVKDLSLAKELTLGVLDSFREVASIGIFHDNAQLALFSLVHLLELHDVGMVQQLQELGFPDRLITLRLGHRVQVHAL
jgi:hypothetical protein